MQPRLKLDSHTDTDNHSEKTKSEPSVFFPRLVLKTRAFLKRVKINIEQQKQTLDTYIEFGIVNENDNEYEIKHDIYDILSVPPNLKPVFKLEIKRNYKIVMDSVNIKKNKITLNLYSVVEPLEIEERTGIRVNHIDETSIWTPTYLSELVTDHKQRDLYRKRDIQNYGTSKITITGVVTKIYPLATPKVRGVTRFVQNIAVSDPIGTVKVYCWSDD